jgi:hypothetical protein
MRRHAGPRRRRERVAWPTGGWALIAVSLASSLYFRGAGIGVVAWGGEITAAGVGLTLVLSFAPR